MPGNLADILARLKAQDEKVRSEAGTELSKLSRIGTLSQQDAETLLRAATDEFPHEGSDWRHPAVSLVQAVANIVKDKDPAPLLPLVEFVFPRLPSSARFAALHIFTLVPTPESAQRYFRLLAAHAASLSDAPLPIFPAEAGPAVARVLFPSLLDLAEEHESLRFSILAALIDARKDDVVPADVAKSHHPVLARMLAAGLAHARKHQQPTGLGWRDDAPYADQRDLTGVLLDLCGRLDSSALLKGLHSCGDLLDPRLRRFRAISLLRRDAEVSDAELEWIARSPRDRYWLHDQLKEMGLAERLPPSCLDQARLAEGAMVDWLCFGTELGREPDEIVLLHKETRSRSSGPRLISWLSKRKPVDYYFFKFRVTEEHWSKENGWQVGMAGGYAREEQPTTSHDGGTFSTFGKLEEKSLKEHVAGYLD